MIVFNILPKPIKEEGTPSHIIHPEYGLLVFDRISRTYSGVISIEMYKIDSSIYTIPDYAIDIPF